MATRTALRASWELSQRPSKRLWGAPATLLDGSWPLLARPGRPKIDFGVAFGCPKTVPSASGRVPETAWGAQNGPRSRITRLFFEILLSCLRRTRLERKSTKNHLKIDGNPPQIDPKSTKNQRTSWFLRCAVASYCSHIFRNDFRTLRVQLFFVAYPQTHLV